MDPYFLDVPSKFEFEIRNFEIIINKTNKKYRGTSLPVQTLKTTHIPPQSRAPWLIIIWPERIQRTFSISRELFVLKLEIYRDYVSTLDTPLTFLFEDILSWHIPPWTRAPQLSFDIRKFKGHFQFPEKFSFENWKSIVIMYQLWIRL